MDRPASPSSADAWQAAGKSVDDLFPLLYGELRRLASAQLARLQVGGTLQPTVLVHEAYLKLVGRAELDWEERRHFFAAAAQAMREIVIDHARRRRAGKRGGGERPLSLDGDALDAAALHPATVDLLAVNAAITRLEVDHPRAAQLAVLRYFGGLTVQEIAGVMGITTRTVERDWRFARAYLHALLEAAPAT